MYRVDNAEAATALPAPGPVGPNPNGFFTAGDPATNTPATVVDADWLNAVQEEIAGVIVNAGLTLSKTDRTQLLQAIFGLAGKNTQSFTAAGTVNWVAPAGVTKVRARVWGGGGGGGGSSSTSLPCGTGGGGGGYVEGVFAVVPGTSYPVTVGIAGVAGATGGGNGGNGGTSSFASFCSAIGGQGGYGNASGGGGGATGSSGGSLTLPGITGSYAIPVGSSEVMGGCGGSAPLMPANTPNVGGAGENATLPGAGGNGAASNAAGGKGGVGLVILDW